ncbi:uncharacterized protein LOC131248741 isoform X2 [Magnolia sinica]|uniref:uncharacterized protein LOC131248741 isoform X2 n=1 Tax=Magnolia sinica TaxID=86752 RepID=UPI0026586378|nr:uncharacterized protein LOC131248741 isoform X2 [Magnolia sinica]
MELISVLEQGATLVSIKPSGQSTGSNRKETEAVIGFVLGQKSGIWFPVIRLLKTALLLHASRRTYPALKKHNILEYSSLMNLRIPTYLTIFM